MTVVRLLGGTHHGSGSPGHPTLLLFLRSTALSDPDPVSQEAKTGGAPLLVASEFAHRPVLLAESVGHLNLQPGAVVVDGTLGGGGHAEAILAGIAPDGILVGFDLDPDALAAAGRRLAPFGDRGRTVRASFRDLVGTLADLGISGVDGVLLDLGVSSFQLDTPARGFRFSGAADETDATPLDMRMNPSAGRTAADLLREASEQTLQDTFQNYGELPGARRLARAIVAARAESPLETTADLLRVIREARVGGGRKHHPATRVFQALRIAVNDELGALREGLDAAVTVLRPGGRLVVIAYHSMEDRVVKNCFRDAQRGCTCPPRIPVCVCGGTVTLKVLTRRPVTPSAREIAENPRARSARLRAAERVGAGAAA
jgi:16S rRNA (cytosine1402-N4)-methyltransferase